jgi:hypothetical protein
MTNDSGFRRRLEMRLKGFSSTLRRRDLCSASARALVFELREMDWS